MFPIDRFDESLIVLKKLYSKDFIDVSYRPTNVNKSKPQVIPEEIKNRIEEMEKEDSKFYQLASTHLDATLKSTFQKDELEGYLRRHQRACKWRSLLLDHIVNFSQKVHIGIRSLKLP